MTFGLGWLSRNLLKKIEEASMVPARSAADTCCRFGFFSFIKFCWDLC